MSEVRDQDHQDTPKQEVQLTNKILKPEAREAAHEKGVTVIPSHGTRIRSPVLKQYLPIPEAKPIDEANP